MSNSFEEERVLKKKSFSFIGFLTIFSLLALVLFYIFTAPSLKERSPISQLLFDAKSAIRRRPTLDSAPFAQVHQGTKLEIVQIDSDWIQVRVKTNVFGWVKSEHATIVPPPSLKLSYRQIARSNIILFVNKIGLTF